MRCTSDKLPCLHVLDLSLNIKSVIEFLKIKDRKNMCEKIYPSLFNYSRFYTDWIDLMD